MTGKEWLAAHDPKYISPQAKGAVTRATPVDPEKLGELLAGVSTRKIGGVWKSVAPIAFCGGETEGEFTTEVIDDNDPEREMILKQREGTSNKSSSKRKSGAQRRKGRKGRNKQKRGKV